MPDCQVCGDPVAPTKANVRRYNWSGMRLCGGPCRSAEVQSPKMNNVDLAVDTRPSMTETLGLADFNWHD